MAREVSFEAQLELAEELRRYLHGLQVRLGAVVGQYKQYAAKLYEARMVDEVHQKFVSNYVEETTSKINTVIELINEQDIPFVDGYIKDLEVLIDTYK